MKKQIIYPIVQKNFWCFLCVLVCLFFNVVYFGMTSCAADEPSDQILEQLDSQEIDRCLKELFPEQRIDFKKTVLDIISGNTKVTVELFRQLMLDRLFYAFSNAKQNLLHIIALALVAAICTNLAKALNDSQVADSGFYIIYHMILILCFESASVMTQWVEDGIQNLTKFMGAFNVIYFPAVAISKGSFTATVFYNFTLLLISVIDLLVLYIIVPMIRIYIVIRLMNYLTKESYLTKFSELIELLVHWSMKTILTCFVGLSIIQSLIHPAIDTVKRSMVTRGAEAIPGIGDLISGTTEVVLATAVLVKNGIGVLGAVICFVLCSIPLIQIGAAAFMYKLASALVQPISDPRIVGCLESVGDGFRMLMKAVFVVGLLFLFTIVIVAAMSNAA